MRPTDLNFELIKNMCSINSGVIGKLVGTVALIRKTNSKFKNMKSSTLHLISYYRPSNALVIEIHIHSKPYSYAKQSLQSLFLEILLCIKYPPLLSVKNNTEKRK